MLDPGIPIPARGRTFSGKRRVGLTDLDPHGRVRLDALARFLQDVAIDDAQETGWGTPEHVWFLRRIRIDLHEPFLEDRELELTTWCSGLAAIAAGRRWSLHGDRGGRAEVDSVWIHLDPAQRPARIEGFGAYGEATSGRRASTKLKLPDPSPGAPAEPWPLRVTDIDLHGHVNNAVYWQAVEQLLPQGGLDPRRPLVAELDYRQPIDLDDRIELVAAPGGEELLVGFRTREGISAAARIQAR